MNGPPTEDYTTNLINENKTLKRRVERMTKELKNLVALHDRAMNLRDYSEREKNLQYEYNILLLENAPDMFFILDPEMRFRLGTKKFVRFLGREDPGTLSDSSFDDLLSGIMPDNWIDSTRAMFENVMRSRNHVQYNDEVILGGNRKIFSMSIAPAVDTGGKVMGVICLMHDSTELVNMKDAAEAATQAKSSFLASMSHEIRTPMNAIKGLSDLMTKTPLSNQQKIYVDNIVNATSSLLMIINDILDFSKIEANRYEIAKTDYDTASELSELCSLMQPKADEKNIYFITDIDPALPSVLVGDSLRIRQILVNIINNAIKFTHKGGILFSVRGELLSKDEWLITYNVKDTGQGIKEEELPKIFQAFEQADYYKNRNISGTGLGLAISRNLAELMGGNISAASEYGVGSEFTIQIPQTSVNGCAIAHVENPKEKKVLFFYPNYELAKHTKRSLKKLGVPYKAVYDAKSLYEAARKGNPTHILIDSDLELAERIAKIRQDARVGCLRTISGLGTDMPDNVRILFKPLLVIGLASFICDQDDGFKNDRANTDKLGLMSFDNARVLIVDDNEINLVVASEILKTYDIETETADSGLEAIEMIKNTNYDIVFMDHMMPNMDGMEATALIRSMDIPQPAIIALTANAMLGMEEIYKKNGFDGYITKPIDVNNLNAILNTWLGSAKPRKD